MAARRSRALAWCGLIAGAVVAGGLVAIVFIANLNTAGQIADVIGAIVGLAAFGLSLYALVKTPSSERAAGGAVVASGHRAVAAGGNIGTAITGDDVDAGPA